MLQVEQLESRDCPTVGITAFDVGAGTVTFIGDSAANVLTLTEAQVDYGDGLKTYLSHDATGGTFADAQDVDPSTGVAHIEVGQGASPLVTVNFGSQADTLKLASSWSFVHPFALSAGVGGDTLDFSASAVAHVVSLTTANAGNVDGSAFASVEFVKGGAGDDVFAFGNAGSIGGTLDGGGGTNTLDYSAITTYSVRTSLAAGTSTTVGSVTNFANVTGGSKNDILQGDGGANVLIGGAGNDILIGRDGDDTLVSGIGMDVLIGGAGADTLDDSASSGSVLVGGGLTYDGSISGPSAILLEWTRAGVSLANRIAHLNGTLAGGLNGSFKINATTLVDDGVADVFTGYDIGRDLKADS